MFMRLEFIQYALIVGLRTFIELVATTGFLNALMSPVIDAKLNITSIHQMENFLPRIVTCVTVE